MITNRELQLFGTAYNNIEMHSGLVWYWSDWNKIRAGKMLIDLAKLPKTYSLTMLIVKLEDKFLRTLPKVDCYQGIAALSNNYDFGDSNYYLFSDGSLTCFTYHKYYRSNDICTLKVPFKNIKWDGHAYGLRCRKVSRSLVSRLTGLGQI